MGCPPLTVGRERFAAFWWIIPKAYALGRQYRADMPACRAAGANRLRFRTGAGGGGRGLRPPHRPVDRGGRDLSAVERIEVRRGTGLMPLSRPGYQGGP